MNVITIEDYKSTYWPKLDGAIDQLLTQSPGDHNIPISYEQIYRCQDFICLDFRGYIEVRSKLNYDSVYAYNI